MKTIERLMKVYIAEDGTEFLTEYQCESYEEDLLKSKQRCEFLNKTILEEMKKIHGIIKWPKDMDLETQAKWIDDNLYIECDENITRLGYLYTRDSKEYREEFDEDCPFDICKWHRFEDTIEFKYRYTIKDSIYYWSK